MYYHTLSAFNNGYVAAYLLNILNILFNALAAILIFYYAFNSPILYKAPYWLFYARLLSDLTGHSFEWQLVQTSFAQGIFWGLLELAIMILPIVPSYIAHGCVTFTKKKGTL